MDLINVTDVPYDPVVETVQRRLLELGYTEIDQVDGKLGRKTEGAILNFRNRNHLPLLKTVDDGLMAALAVAQPIALPIRQKTATEAEIAPRIDAVQQTRWAKFWAKVAAWPSLVLAMMSGIVANLGDAVNALVPVKTFLNDHLSAVQPITMVTIGTSAVAVVSCVLWLKSRQAEGSMKDKYRDGTLKDDNKEAPDVPVTP